MGVGVAKKLLESFLFIMEVSAATKGGRFHLGLLFRACH